MGDDKADEQYPNAAQMAFPIQASEIMGGLNPEKGLTKRELFAAMAMQAILTGAVTRACPSHEWTDQCEAVKVADALLAELERTRE